MKMSNFKNPTWWTAAILKIVIAPYLSCEFDEIWYADAGDKKCDKNSQIPKFKMADECHIENHFFGCNSAPYCMFKTKFAMKRHNRTHTKVR